MAREKPPPVTVTHRPVAKAKRKRLIAERKRAAWLSQVRVPQGMTALTRYVDENMESGLPVDELIWQFQEYDCEHEYRQIATSGKVYWQMCDGCGRVERMSR